MFTLRSPAGPQPVPFEPPAISPAAGASAPLPVPGPAPAPRRWPATIGPGLVGVALATVWVAPGAPTPARLTLTVFIAAVVLWTATDLDDTLVALGAAAAATLVAGGGVEGFHASLGSGTVWLLIASFVIAAGVQRSGLASLVVEAVLRRAGTVSSLCWRTTAALGALTFVVPATSGRAALAMPVYLALHRHLPDPRVRRALALLFPTVILLSASASLLGAGAHLVAMDLVGAAGGEPLSFARWALLAFPCTAISCAAGTAAILYLHLDADTRRSAVSLPAPEDRPAGGTHLAIRRRVGAVLAVVLLAWCSTGWHGIEPSVVAVLGAIAVCAPGRGGTRITDAIDDIPWALVLFLAATTALGDALLTSGAADWLGGRALAEAATLPAVLVVAAVVAVSLVAHLVIGSRSARASVLVPLVIVTATAAGLDATALVFASSMAAGYCLTLTVSAKPVAMFQRPFGRDGEIAYESGDLLRLSTVLLPVHFVLVTVCSLVVWPALGLSL